MIYKVIRFCFFFVLMRNNSLFFVVGTICSLIIDVPLYFVNSLAQYLKQKQKQKKLSKKINQVFASCLQLTDTARVIEHENKNKKQKSQNK